MKKAYRDKYKKELSWDEGVFYFSVKMVGSVALFFIAAIGMDVYR